MRKVNIDRDCEVCGEFKKASQFFDAYDKNCRACSNLVRRNERKTNVPDLPTHLRCHAIWTRGNA